MPHLAILSRLPSAQMVNGQLAPQPPSPDNIFLAGNTSATGPLVPEGQTAKFQCCIHPWMRMTINAKEHLEHSDGHDRYFVRAIRGIDVSRASWPSPP